MKSFFIDTRYRELPLYLVWVTWCDPMQGVCLRMAAEISKKTTEYVLKDVLKWSGYEEGEDGRPLHTPILVPTRGYQARETGGFVNVHLPGGWPTTRIVGQQGLSGSGSLRPWKHGRGAFIYKPEIRECKTGFCPGKGHSNPAQAAAARCGLRTRARALREIIVAEGQSDYCGGIAIVGKKSGEGKLPPEHNQEKLFPKPGEKWEGVDMVGVELSGIDLSGIDLSDANLSGAILTDANLTKAWLVGTNLSNTNLTGANLTGAFLAKANVHRCNLTGANLTGANLTGANLTGAILTDAVTEGVIPPGNDHVGAVKN